MSKKIIDYKLVCLNDPINFTAQVTKLLRDGWYIHGETKISTPSDEYGEHTLYSQAMVKYE